MKNTDILMRQADLRAAPHLNSPPPSTRTLIDLALGTQQWVIQRGQVYASVLVRREVAPRRLPPAVKCLFALRRPHRSVVAIQSGAGTCLVGLRCHVFYVPESLNGEAVGRGAQVGCLRLSRAGADAARACPHYSSRADNRASSASSVPMPYHDRACSCALQQMHILPCA